MNNNTVMMWDRFEAAIENPHTYADPYRDVRLLTQFERPDGSRVEFWGFYDGGTTWRFRFMPDQAGRWAYRAAFSDGSASLTGTFSCVPSAIPGALQVNPLNPHWFQHRQGDPFFMRAFHVGDCFFSTNLSPASRKAFLDWACQQGYNTLSIASHYLNRSEPGRGAGYDTPRLYPLDYREFQRAEAILNDLAERRLVVFPFAGFFGRASGYPTDPAEQEQYIRYVLARFGAYWNLLFNVAGPEPLLPKNPFMEKEEINRLGRLIRSLDVFAHPISVHNRTGDDEFIAEDWLTFTTLQGPKTTDLAALSAGLRANLHPQRPLFAQETLWSGNKYHPDYSDEQLRKNAFVLHFSGAFFCFIDNGGPDPAMLGDSSSGFSGSLNLADRRQWRHDIVAGVWNLLQSFPVERMHPCPQAVENGYCLAEENQRYLVYLPHPGSLRLNLPDGRYTARWISAADGLARLDAGETAGKASLAAPQGADDWLLYLERIPS